MRNAIQNQPEQIIQNRLSAIQRRMRIEGVFQNLATFNLWGLLTGGILLVANRFFPLPIPIGFAIALPIAIASAIAVGLNLIRKIDPFAVAHFVDQRLNLKERLGTALEAMDRRGTGDFAILQIRDAARASQEIVPAAAFSYTVPSILKWFPIPMLLVGLSFFIPRMYEIPPPPNSSEHAAIHDAAAKLEGAVSGFDNTELSKQVEETAKALRNKRTGVQAAQEKLSQLHEDVQARRSQLAENELDQAVETISKLNADSNLLSGANTKEIASELQKLADQMDGLTEAQRAELDALLRQLAERLGDNPAAKNLVDQLNEIGTEGVSPEMLAKIARSLLEIDQQAKNMAQMEEILEEIKTSRKNIGLAGIEMARKTGGVAGSDGGPGEESETGEARGTQVDAMPSESQPTETLQLRGATSDSEEFSTTSTQETPNDSEEEPTYMPYRQAYLNAKQAYAEAVERDEIPVRYRQRVKDYLDAIANTEK